MQIEKGYLLSYNLLQLLGLPLLPFLGIYGLCRPKYRKQFLLRLGLKTKDLQGPGPRIWIHAMSLGEYHAARPLIKAVSNTLPEAKIIVSASTRSGLEAILRDKDSPRDLATALPFDLFPVVRKVVKTLKPDCFILVETDIWPNLIHYLRRHNCKTILANGSISSKAASRISKVPGAAKFLYGGFSCIAMQSEDDAARLRNLGIDDEKVVVPGNIKFDVSPPEISREDKAELLKATGFSRQSRIICCGSTHEPEERILLETFSMLKTRHNISLIVAPRDVKRAKSVEAICNSLGLKVGRRSAPPTGQVEVFILDTLGELLKFYSICHIAFVGGTLAPIGGHNLLEPVYFGKPVLFGPHVESCRDMAKALSESGSGAYVRDKKELADRLTRLLSNREEYEKSEIAASSFLRCHKGVIHRYTDLIKGLLENDN